MTRVHGLQHVKGLLAANLTKDDAIGTHAQAVDQELPLPDGSLPFHIGRAGLEADQVFLRELQFSRILNRDHALALGNMRERILSKVFFLRPCLRK